MRGLYLSAPRISRGDDQGRLMTDPEIRGRELAAVTLESEMDRGVNVGPRAVTDVYVMSYPKCRGTPDKSSLYYQVDPKNRSRLNR
ncbi:hypothetical protein AVEN_27474-1 [Araneus ventricosus]|uniref:Uncharacterized protein n=1 Tax=Araneus ventricosus TaxID=182803 RepID=A0A4Y2RWG7_ARAVE|nr:hypothetical protein AVEN_27474-1 [Araneus ventricosus]